MPPDFLIEQSTKNMSLGIALPGGSSPRPPFSRFARRAVVGRADLLTGPSYASGFLDRTKYEKMGLGIELPGGSSPRKHDDLLTGAACSVKAVSGEDPPGRPI
jgi:hypothetical protein